MAKRDQVSIVAHRGHGPTNRTRGGLIGQDDPRRTDNPAENSQSAFDAAFAATTKDNKVPALDGIECDVFLSSDSIPILSHEGAVKEQLSQAQQLILQGLVGDNTHIGDLSSDQLKYIQRTTTPGSNFLTLEDFLNATTDVATAYYQITNKPLRVEIEMKGHPSDHAIEQAQSGLGTRNQKKNRAREFCAEYGVNLATQVAKKVSKFKKNNPGPCWEIILFNNDKADAQAFDILRNTKSHLGGLYTLNHPLIFPVVKSMPYRSMGNRLLPP